MEQNKNYKRKTRQMPDATKQKISAALRGRKKSFSHCQAISKGLKEKYWASIRWKNEQWEGFLLLVICVTPILY